MSAAVCWFKDDLRVDDNPALVAAAAGATRLVCLYCVDARWTGAGDYGAERTGTQRQAFTARALVDLARHLGERGAELWVVRGAPERVLPGIVRAAGATGVWTQAEIAPEERATSAAVGRALRSVGAALHETPAHTLYAREALPFDLDAMPRVFTRFRHRVEAGASVGAPVAAPPRLPGPGGPPPDLIRIDPSTLDPGAPDLFHGGESGGRARLKRYLWDSRAVLHYRHTRNGLLGHDDSSKLSPWLARGCLSVRRAAAELARFETEVGADDSTYGLFFELLWREFFQWTLRRHGARLFRRGGLLDRRDRPVDVDARVLHVWKQGMTGVPFIDAAMRELAVTGYMSNRARQNVASFFARDLQQDWRWGAAWFEARLVDYDVASNWGNWANVAGVGTDKRDRGFNILAQARRYDPDAAYVTAWVPELARLPVAFRHAPWRASSAMRAGLDYPPPLCVNAEWRAYEVVANTG